jgi:fibronectin-binding autotransporter adhesin
MILVNNGTINYAETTSTQDLFLESSQITNSGTFNWNGTANQIWTNSTGTFRNEGVFKVTESGAPIGVFFDAIAGSTIDVADTKTISFGSLDLQGSSTLSGLGAVVMTAVNGLSSHSISAGSVITGGVRLDSATLTIPASATLSYLDWYDGTISGAGNLTLSTGGTSRWGAGNTHLIIDATTITNNGVIIFAETGVLDDLYINNFGQITNANIFNWSGSQNRLASQDGLGTFRNEGTFNATTTGGVVSVAFDAINNSITDVAATHSLRFSALNLQGNSTLSGLGTVVLGNGNHSIAAGSVINGGVRLDAGTLNVPGTATVDYLEWYDGTISGAGNLILASGGSSSWGAGNSSLTIDAATLTNNGSILYSESGILERIILNNSSEIVNVGTFTWQGDLGQVTTSTGVGTFTNNGTLVKPGVGVNRELSPTVFSNEGGIIDIQSGSIGFSGATLTIGAGSVLSGSGTLNDNVINDAGTVSPGSGTEDIGTLTINGTYTQNANGKTLIELNGNTAAGTDFDLLKVTGAVVLGGNLQIDAFAAYTPLALDTYNGFLDSDTSLTGTYATVTSVGFDFPIYDTVTNFDASIQFVSNEYLYFDNSSGTFLWNDPLNWSTDLLPASDSEVYINLVGQTVIFDTGDHVIAALNGIAGNLTLSGGSLSITSGMAHGGGLTISSAASLVLQGVSNTVGGAFVNNGLLAVRTTGATNAALTLPAGSTLGGTILLDNSAGNQAQLISPSAQTLSGTLQSVGTGADNLIQIADLTTIGIMDIDHNLTLSNVAATLQLNGNQVVDVAVGQTFTVDGGGVNWDGGTLLGAGTLARVNGATLGIGVASDGGQLLLDGLTVTLTDAVLENNTELSVSSGQLDIVGSLTIASSAELFLNGGQINLALGGVGSTQQITLNNGRLTASAGSINGIGSNGLISIDNVAGSTLTVNADSGLTLTDIDIANNRDLVLDNGASLVFNNDATLDNNASGAIRINGDVLIDQSGFGPFVVNNSGSIIRNSGQGVAVIDLPVLNNGTLTLNSGQLDLQRGMTQAAGSTTTAAGSTLNLASLILGGGSMTSNGIVDIAGVFTWNGASSIAGNGLGSLNLNGASAVSGAGAHNLVGITLNNAGTLTLASTTGNLTLDGVQFNNLATASVNLAGNVTLAGTGAASSFVNSGSLSKTAGTGIGSIGDLIAITNVGTVTAGSGELSLLGSYVQSAVDATTLISAGNSLSVNTFALDAGVVSVASGTLSASQPIAIASGASMDVNGNLNAGVVNAGQLNVNGRIESAQTVRNEAGENLSMSGIIAADVVNAGLLEIDGSIGDVDGGLRNDLTNSGVVSPGIGAGDFSRLVINGNYAQTGGQLRIEVSRPVDGSPAPQSGVGYDALEVLGNINIVNSGVDFQNTGAPILSAVTYNFLTWSGTRTGSFDDNKITKPDALALPLFDDVARNYAIEFIEGGLISFLNTLGDGDLFNDANWSGGLAPISGSADNVVINLDGVTPLTISGLLDVNSLETTQPLTIVDGGSLLVAGDAIFNNSFSIANSVFNDATISAQFGGTARFNNSLTLSNAVLAGEGILVANAGVQIDGRTSIQGLSLNNPLNRTMAINADLVLDGGALVSNAGTLDIQGDFNLLSTDASGLIQNFGTLLRSSGTGDIRIQADLMNTRTVNFATGTATIEGNYTQSAGSLSSANDVMVDGFTIWNGGIMNSGGVYNANGGIAINGPVTLNRTLSNSGVGLLAGLGAIAGSGQFNNLGTFDIQNNTTIATAVNNGGSLSKTQSSGVTTIGGAFVNTGNVLIDSGEIQFLSTFVQDSGRFINNGTITLDNMVINGGFVGGNSTINGDVTFNGGELAPGNSVGVININGDLFLTSNSLLTMEVSAADVFDVINVTGTAVYDGRLTVTFIEGYTGTVSDSYQFITYSTASGAIDTIDSPLGYQFSNTNTSTSQLFTLTSVAAAATSVPATGQSGDVEPSVADPFENTLTLIDDNETLFAMIVGGDFQPTEKAGESDDNDKRQRRANVCR